MNTHDADLHIEEFKVRLKPADADLLRALAAKRRTPPAVLARSMLVAALESVPIVAQVNENRRPV